jgi:hypothetical protein
VFESKIPAPVSLTSSGLSPLTVAFVPTGMKHGVSNDPWGVWILPNLAFDCLQVLIGSYQIGNLSAFLFFIYYVT